MLYRLGREPCCPVPGRHVSKTCTARHLHGMEATFLVKHLPTDVIMSTLGQEKGKGEKSKERQRSINYGKSIRGITCKVSHATEPVAWLDRKQARKTLLSV